MSEEFEASVPAMIGTAGFTIGGVALGIAINAENEASKAQDAINKLAITNVGDVSLVAKGTGPHFEMLGLKAGDNVTLESDGKNVIISAEGPTGASGQAIVGPTGASGVQGATGNVGPSGASGQSIVGPTGATGPLGVTGASVAGPTGASGASGQSIIGSTGITGQSFVGATGASGLSITGPTGASGLVGVSGASGATGVPVFTLTFASGTRTDTTFGDRNVTLTTDSGGNSDNTALIGFTDWTTLSTGSLGPSGNTINFMATNGNFAIVCPFNVTSFELKAILVLTATSPATSVTVNIGIARTNSPPTDTNAFTTQVSGNFPTIGGSTGANTFFALNQTFTTTIPSGALIVGFMQATSSTTTSTQFFASGSFRFFA